MKTMQSHLKLRIKIPRLVVFTKMQRKLHLQVKDKATNSANNRENGKARTKRGNQFPRISVGSVFSCVLGNKRYPSKVNKNGDENEWHIDGRTSSNEPVGAALSQLLALEPNQAGEEKHQRVKMNLPLLSFLDKNKGWNNFIKAKSKRNRSSSDGNDIVTKFRQVRRKASSYCRLVRIPPKILIIRLKLKMIRALMKKKVTKQFEQGADENRDKDKDGELCKKRILMGRKCKPLSSPGTLSYD